MLKLTMMRGLPASGKSSTAELLVREGFVRVNRDLLREMFNFGEFKHEDMVVDTEKFVVSGFLGQGKNVVVDDCNLNPANEDMWRNIAQQYKADFIIVDVPTDVETCVIRDKGRAKEVGENVIRNMALQYGLVNLAKPVVICDIDGTIADINHRLHFVKDKKCESCLAGFSKEDILGNCTCVEGKKDWKGFFAAMDKDTIREDVLKMLQDEVLAGHEVMFVSARPEEYRKVTEQFLRTTGIPFNHLLMRPTGDKRDDTIIKTNIYKKYLSAAVIRRVYDDRPKVIRMWRELGLEVVDVGEGIEF